MPLVELEEPTLMVGLPSTKGGGRNLISVSCLIILATLRLFDADTRAGLGIFLKTAFVIKSWNLKHNSRYLQITALEEMFINQLYN